MIRRCVLGLVAFLATAVLLGSAPGTALESEGFTLTDEHLKASKEFGPIALFTPAATVAAPTLDDCKAQPFYNAVKVGIAIKSTIPAKARFSVDWPGTAESNDIDVYFFQGDGVFISDAATQNKPETFTLAGLPNGTYYVCVANFAGANAGFTLSAEMNFVDLFEPPPPPPTGGPQRTPTVKVKPATDDEPEVSATPAVTPEAIDRPGADGPTKEQELVAVSGSRQAASADEGRSGLSIGLLAATGVIVATGAGLVFVRIRRDTRLD